ncbi:chemotaxis protein CheW [Athalassotoga saccharophila]|uniref:chemotaxis protein CheW n=1 Tax=Athalassotoga saccharophila TaxID=1441386 RepID=UPI00137A5DDC|nr:chemotaxis protein CheW [Athalassotoga saccharophila]BBJ27969.1 chemotaxis protein CheW [Athalassotoga saccharophila]
MKTFDKPFEVLGVRIGDKEYAIDIGVIGIIVETSEIARVPNSKSFLKGVMNLRGRIVPVIDTKRITSSSAKESAGANVVVTQIDENEVGFLVDGVTEVMWVQPSEFDSTIKIDNSNYVKGVIMKGNRLISMLDLQNFVRDQISS